MKVRERRREKEPRKQGTTIQNTHWFTHTRQLSKCTLVSSLVFFSLFRCCCCLFNALSEIERLAAEREAEAKAKEDAAKEEEKKAAQQKKYEKDQLKKLRSKFRKLCKEAGDDFKVQRLCYVLFTFVYSSRKLFV